jgi:hypothetical protein
MDLDEIDNCVIKRLNCTVCFIFDFIYYMYLRKLNFWEVDHSDGIVSIFDDNCLLLGSILLILQKDCLKDV